MKVFFSHSSRDKALVSAIKRNLPEHLAAWIDEHELLIGSDITDSIYRAIRSDVDFVVIFLGGDAIASEWVKRELAWALDREKELKRTFVIPVLLEDIWSRVEPAAFQRRLYLRCFDQTESQIQYVANQLYDQIVKHVFKNIGQVTQLQADLESTLEALAELARSMSTEEKQLLRLISLQPGKGLQLTDSFERDGDFHNTLRQLRDRNLIQPTQRGTWESGKHVRTTDIARALLSSERFRKQMLEDGLPIWWHSGLEPRRMIMA